MGIERCISNWRHPPVAQIRVFAFSDASCWVFADSPLQTFERLSVGVHKVIEKEYAVINHDTSPRSTCQRSEMAATDIDLHQPRLHERGGF
jgi:hypothetical protein